MLFGCFMLDQFGQVWSVEKRVKGQLKVNDDVEDYWGVIQEAMKKK